MLNEERWGAYNKLEKLHHSFFLTISVTLVTSHVSVRMSVVRGRAHWQLLSAAPRSGSSAWLHACGYQHSHLALQWTGKGTLAPGLHTNACFYLKGMWNHHINAQQFSVFIQAEQEANWSCSDQILGTFIDWDRWRLFLWQIQNTHF